MNLLARVLARLLPATGTRRRTPVADPAPAPPPRRVITPPRRSSPYARDAADDRTLYVDPPLWNTLRPYVHIHVHTRAKPVPPKQRAQAHRRWALEMALRGRDVGPERIHGVRVGRWEAA
ncbi:hypothetical protein QIS99_18405 [Streptomyces sp. B-S-A8]|uniref:Uncharacterized protein n=1 Tax=Streptomyces solicavernae TaxID=3043614 RepID=A0ABT6RUP0_9ACTN|nr:hypothetical protein [Streptomyces sp. B-S-A8]MDI3388159.1 hypothetical protein [Streptomyces sp. B-S-A8]